MLCYYHVPNGYGKAGHRHVSGCLVAKQPYHFTYNEYLKHRDILIHAAFTPEYLEEKLNKKDFPHRAMFTMDMLKEFDHNKLKRIAAFVGVSIRLPHTKMIYAVRNAIKDL